MGGGVLLLSAMTFFLPLQIIVPIHGICQLTSNSSRAFFLKDKINKKIFAYFTVGAPFGTFAAVYLLKTLKNPDWALILMPVLIFYVLFKPKKLPKLKIPQWSFLIVGFIAGILGPLVGATGPFLAIFFLRDDLAKENIVATKAATQFIIHLIKIPAFIYLAFPYLDYSLLIISMALANILGTFYGVKILKKLPEMAFIYLYKSALLLAGIRIIYKIIAS